jgi:hypothetical protein
VSSNGGVIQLVIAHATWEQPSIPEYTALARSTNSDPTQFEIDPVTAMLGLELPSMDAPWPSYTDTPFLSCGGDCKGADCFPDQDEDGERGITLDLVLNDPPPPAASWRRGDWSYTPFPTGASLPYLGIGATRLFTGLRARFGGAYPVGADCNGDTGAAESGDVALRVLDCTMFDGARCTPYEATVADRNMPVFHALRAGEVPPNAWKDPQADRELDRSASTGARNTVVRLGDVGAALGCADVREIFASTP